MKAVLFALNAKYIHSSLAPWCLLAGVEAAGPAGVCAEVREGTVNEPERDVLARILDGEPDAVLFSCYLWNIRETLRLAAAVKAARPGAYVVLGGPEVSYNAGEVLADNPQVFLWVSGHTHTAATNPNFAAPVNRYKGRIVNLYKAALVVTAERRAGGAVCFVANN